MKRILLVLLPLLLLAGCAQMETFAAAGEYVTLSMAAGDLAVESDDSQLDLLPDGSCRSTLRGSEETGTWSEKGNDVTVRFGKEEFSGAREGDILNFSCVYDFTLSRNPADKPVPVAEQEEEPALPDEPKEEPFSFAGDWYGYWVVTEATGSLEESAGMNWDLCGRAVLDKDGNGNFLLWDEDYSEDNVLGALIVTQKEEELLVTGGFFGADELTDGEWVFTKDSLGYENLISASGSYEDTDGSYAYTLYLRPWGTVWDDVATSERPRSYEKWYLPLVEKGKGMTGAIWKK